MQCWHVGGFVISRGPLEELVPIENAAMPERTVIQWDKNDLDALGLLKVDVLGLGMLSALRKSLELMKAFRGREYTLASIPAEDPVVYEMIQRADTVGVFQIESRAQMSMLPRLKPQNFYDLVIEVAIVRPGPIQGDMVHPYLRRRSGEEPESYPSAAVEKVLKRTLGVPIFQEQVMQLAMVAAGFTPGEADDLRRSMAAWKRRGGLEHFQQRLLSGMTVDDFDTQSPTTFGHSNAAGSEAVGAAAWYNTAEWGPAFHPACVPACAEIFSSAGGTPILFDINGKRLNKPIVRVKPGVVGPDGGNTSFFFALFPFEVPGSTEPDEFPNFFGTSASAPHVAAVAALMKLGSGIVRLLDRRAAKRRQSHH